MVESLRLILPLMFTKPAVSVVTTTVVASITPSFEVLSATKFPITVPPWILTREFFPSACTAKDLS